MIDTNIMISAVLFPRGKASLALKKALLPPFQAVICDYVLKEFMGKFDEKFPEAKADMEAFLDDFLPATIIAITPTREIEGEVRIRDQKDRPILRAALAAKVDLLLTGDKDFLEAEVVEPRIISVAEFLGVKVKEKKLTSR